MVEFVNAENYPCCMSWILRKCNYVIYRVLCCVLALTGTSFKIKCECIVQCWKSQ